MHFTKLSTYTFEYRYYTMRYSKSTIHYLADNEKGRSAGAVPLLVSG
jgi:hypothetical protein